MNNLEEIINKYKLQYNKDKSYFKFNFQYEYNAQYFTFKNYIKQCNTDIKIINIINICNKIPIDTEDFRPIYNFFKSKRNIIYFLDDRNLINKLSSVCEGCEHVIFYNLPILLFFNGSPIFTDLNILDIHKLNRLLNNYSEGKKCNVCYDIYLRGHFCRKCYYNICSDCYYKLRYDKCPFCRTEF